MISVLLTLHDKILTTTVYQYFWYSYLLPPFPVTPKHIPLNFKFIPPSSSEMYILCRLVFSMCQLLVRYTYSPRDLWGTVVCKSLPVTPATPSLLLFLSPCFIRNSGNFPTLNPSSKPERPLTFLQGTPSPLRCLWKFVSLLNIVKFCSWKYGCNFYWKSTLVPSFSEEALLVPFFTSSGPSLHSAFTPPSPV